MFRILSNEFTPEELEALADATGTWISAYEGPAPDVAQMQALHEKINRLRLLGRKVRFNYEGETLEGTLERYLDLEGLQLAEIVRAGYVYRVDLAGDNLLGPVETPV